MKVNKLILYFSLITNARLFMQFNKKFKDQCTSANYEIDEDSNYDLNIMFQHNFYNMVSINLNNKISD